MRRVPTLTHWRRRGSVGGWISGALCETPAFARRTGVGRGLGLVASLIREAERASQRAQREQQRELAKANARLRTQQERERTKANVAAYRAARQAEAARMTADVEWRVQLLRDAFTARPRNAAFDVATATTPEDACARAFKRLRPTFIPSAFAAGAAVGPSPEAPRAESMRRTVPPPSGLQRLFGGAKKHAVEVDRVAREDAEQFATALQRHAAAVAEWQSRVDAARRAHTDAMARREREVREKVAAVEEWEAGVRDQDPDAVVQYIAHVLDSSDYPEEIEEDYDLSYNPDAKVLTLEYVLPAPDVIPAARAFAYTRTTDAFTPKLRTKTESTALYRSLVAALSLRTIREIYAAVPTSCLESITFHGLVDGVDPTTGLRGRLCVVSAHVSRDAVGAIQRQGVDPTAFLTAAGAAVSKKPEAPIPVRRVDEGGRIDARFVSSSRVRS